MTFCSLQGLIGICKNVVFWLTERHRKTLSSNDILEAEDALDAMTTMTSAGCARDHFTLRISFDQIYGILSEWSIYTI